jgi:hypothetical protein
LRQARKDLWSKAEVTLDAGTVVVASLAIAPEADTTEVSCGDPIKVAKISSTGPEALLLRGTAVPPPQQSEICRDPWEPKISQQLKVSVSNDTHSTQRLEVWLPQEHAQISSRSINDDILLVAHHQQDQPKLYATRHAARDTLFMTAHSPLLMNCPPLARSRIPTTDLLFRCPCAIYVAVNYLGSAEALQMGT